MNNQQQQGGNPPNRLNLNFGFTDRNNGNYAADGRAYPTTPSTFPQPVFPNPQSGQQEVWGTQQTNNGYAQPGYFPQAGYQGGYQQQGNLQTPSAAYRAPQYNDGTNGLVHQFSHQNLGGGRAASPYGRQPSPSQRPRTAGATGQPYGSYLNPEPRGPRAPSIYDEEPPAKTPEKYSDNVNRQSKVSVGLVSTFFKDSVQRARDRNQR